MLGYRAQLYNFVPWQGPTNFILSLVFGNVDSQVSDLNFQSYRLKGMEFHLFSNIPITDSLLFHPVYKDNKNVHRNFMKIIFF